MLATTFLHNTFKNSIFLLCFLIKNKFPLYKVGDKNFHTPGASFCSKQNNNNSNKYFHHSHNRIFCRWPERGKTFSHRKNDFIWESRTIFCYVEKNKYFSHLHYHFFSTFSPDYLLLQLVAQLIALPSSVSMTLTLLRCVDLRFNILCAVELLDSIWHTYIYIYFFCRRNFLVVFCFCDNGFFRYEIFFCFKCFTRTFFSSWVLFTIVVIVLPSHYENKVRSWSSLFTDLCSVWLCEGFVVNVLVFKC